MILRDYTCPRCSITFEEYGSPDDTPACPECAAPSEYVLSPTGLAIPTISVVKGGVDAAPNPYALDTTAYGRGEQGYGEWRTKRDKHLDDLRMKDVKRWMR